MQRIDPPPGRTSVRQITLIGVRTSSQGMCTKTRQPVRDLSDAEPVFRATAKVDARARLQAKSSGQRLSSLPWTSLRIQAHELLLPVEMHAGPAQQGAQQHDERLGFIVCEHGKLRVRAVEAIE